jgi:hypothetical protein
MLKAAACASVAVLIAGLVDIEPVCAQFGGLSPGGIIGGIMSGARYGHGGGHGHHASRDHDDDDSSAPKKDKNSDDRVLATLGAPSQRQQTSILKSITVSGDAGAVGTKSIGQIGVAMSSEADRDYTKQIADIIDVFKGQQSKSSTPGDVTAHAIEQSLDRAFKDSKLDTFETFVGENWSAERLRVMILKRVRSELDALFQGNNRGNAPMEELDHLIQTSAKVTYDRLFEISELLASNRSTSLFAQRLYQTQGNLVDDQLREDADRIITVAANRATLPFETAMRRDPNGMALRYRAERIVLDCLSENVARITSSETGIATIGEIEQRVAKTATSDCEAWLQNQFGTEKDRLKGQKPMPLRAVWSPTGPRDDASMYGRASGGPQ